MLLYCYNFSTFGSLLTASIFFKCEYITHASSVRNRANCPWRLHSEHYDFVITHKLHCGIAFDSLSANFRSCFCGPAFSGPAFFRSLHLVLHFQVLLFQVFHLFFRSPFSSPAFSVHPPRTLAIHHPRNSFTHHRLQLTCRFHKSLPPLTSAGLPSFRNGSSGVDGFLIFRSR